MRHDYGFFDVDCRELNDAGDGLQFRPRMLPLASNLHRLYECAEEKDSPIVCTTCCSGHMLDGANLPGILFVPLAAEYRDWEASLESFRMFYLQKKAYGDPRKNFACRAFDMFQDNGNAARLVRALGVREWVVFGNALDLCVNAAVRGLLAAGQHVCLLTDVTVPSATGYGENGTAENGRKVIAELGRLGARISTLEQAMPMLN